MQTASAKDGWHWDHLPPEFPMSQFPDYTDTTPVIKGEDLVRMIAPAQELLKV